VVWLVFNVLIALLLVEMGVFEAISKVLALYSNVAIAWIGALVGDLVINKPLKLSPSYVEFKRAHLYDVNPVGIGAMFVASAVVVHCIAGCVRVCADHRARHPRPLLSGSRRQHARARRDPAPRDLRKHLRT
jgi:hypothetical protein